MCCEFCCILSDQLHFSKAYMRNRQSFDSKNLASVTFCISTANMTLKFEIEG